MSAKDHLQPNQWSDDDRRRFADRDILRSTKVPGKRKPPPKREEWD